MTETSGQLAHDIMRKIIPDHLANTSYCASHYPSLTQLWKTLAEVIELGRKGELNPPDIEGLKTELALSLAKTEFLLTALRVIRGKAAREIVTPHEGTSLLVQLKNYIDNVLGG